jgi:asparagine synthase (glutamine-hydrolysing)
MCGIAVSLSSRDSAPELSLEPLRHRGPDSQGEWRSADGHVWLGHTRLAILDLSSAGAQPMIDFQTGNVIVFNGEIYNHRALRELLNREGCCSWNGTSDTETLLAAYRVWGPDMLGRLKGMFALALYDARQKGLFLARDRFGIKLLYYSTGEQHFMAASETRALPVAFLGKVVPRQLASYLRWGACPEEDLLFPQIKILPAGHYMFVSPTGELEMQRYWPGRQPIRTRARDPVQQVRALLERAVEEHLLADVPVASFLSGGIDSSIITALAARKAKEKLLTFSVGFKQPGFDETAIAHQVATRWKTEHTRVELSDEETLQIIREGVDKLDLPSVDALNTYIVSRKVSEYGIRVALSGLGGDELFGGYPSFKDVPRLKWLSHFPASMRRRLGWLGPLGKRLADLPNGNTTELTIWRRRFWTDAMLTSACLPIPPAAEYKVPDLPDDFAQISWVELTRYMRQILLRDSDQMSMAVSLELRVPFLDHELVEFVLGLPASDKKRGAMPKALLVEACKDLLPESVYRRPKMGFGLPMNSWIRGPLKDLVQSGLSEAAARSGLAEGLVQGLYAQFKQGSLHWTRLWSVVVLGHFLRRATSRSCERDQLNQKNISPQFGQLTLLCANPSLH